MVRNDVLFQEIGVAFGKVRLHELPVLLNGSHVVHVEGIENLLVGVVDELIHFGVLLFIVVVFADVGVLCQIVVLAIVFIFVLLVVVSVVLLFLTLSELSLLLEPREFVGTVDEVEVILIEGLLVIPSAFLPLLLLDLLLLLLVPLALFLVPLVLSLIIRKIWPIRHYVTLRDLTIVGHETAFVVVAGRGIVVLGLVALALVVRTFSFGWLVFLHNNYYNCFFMLGFESDGGQ